MRLRMLLGGIALAAAIAGPAQAADDVKIGFITKFPVPFFATMEDAAKAYAAAHPGVEIVFGQGTSATDIEGQIALIESMVTQGVQDDVTTFSLSDFGRTMVPSGTAPRETSPRPASRSTRRRSTSAGSCSPAASPTARWATLRTLKAAGSTRPTASPASWRDRRTSATTRRRRATHG